jgi:acyl-CoA carboxylase subunit beta
VTRLSARELIDSMIDPGSFHSWDEPIDRTGYDPAYRAELGRAEHKADTGEAVLTGRACIRRYAAALVVSIFGFLGGSIGIASATRIIAAIQPAIRERLPLIAALPSGGTRVQEGTPAFVQMVQISRAVVAPKADGLPYLVYLWHPTAGDVFASWGSLGQVTVAEPEALIGFLGPVVHLTLYGRLFPEDIQLAENLVDKGIVDAVVRARDLADVAARALGLLSRRPGWTLPPARVEPTPGALPDGDSWSSIMLTRRPDRPGVREILCYAADEVLPLSGTKSGEAGNALLLLQALTSFSGMPCVLIGQDREAQARNRRLGTTVLRSARRGMRIAQELDLPPVCAIDTPGAELSAAAEEGALAEEIARCLAEMVQLTVPAVAVLQEREPAAVRSPCYLLAGRSQPATPRTHRCHQKMPGRSCMAVPSRLTTRPAANGKAQPSC